MSASNWTTCPRCAARREAELTALEAEVTAVYGSVSAAEYARLGMKLIMAREMPLAQTWREDCEFYGAEDGVLSIRYSGGCEVCGLRHEFSADQPIEGLLS